MPEDPTVPAVPDAPAADTAPKRTLEESLSGLDDDTRTFVLGQVKKARTEAQNLRERLTSADAKVAEYEPIVQASKTADQRKDEDLVRWQTEAERWRTTSVASRIEALAAPDFADPSDAASNLDPAKYLGASGEIDQEQIRTDLADLLERKPHYKRASDTPPGPRTPAPNPAQGAGGTATADPAAEFAQLLQARMRL